MDLNEFLLARIAEDEAVARAATAGSWEVRPYWFTSNGRSWATVPHVIDEDIDAEDAEHIARWDPARVLAECEAKRRIVEREARRRTIKDTVVASSHSTLHPWVSVTTADGETTRMDSAEFEERFTEPADSEVLRDLALPYADHPDYREEWRP